MNPPTLAPTPTVFIASDHAAVSLKAALQKLIPEAHWSDIGPHDTHSVDYPDYAEKLCAQIRTTPGSMGILICGSGIGMSIAANKIAGIRAALVENPVSARLAREHNDANVLCLGARFLAAEYAAEIAQVFLKTPASKDPRHGARVEKLKRLDQIRTP